MFNVLGEPIDGGEEIDDACEKWNIHREAPSFDEQSPAVEILETGIKVIDLLAPYPKGGIKTSSPANYRTVLAVRRYW